MELNRVYQGDCAQLLQELEADSIDLTVTSPPYDGLRKYNGYEFDFEAIAGGLYRATKQGGVVVWVVGDAVIDGSETGTSFRQALYFMDCGFRLHDTMIYEKNGTPFPDKVRYYQAFEFMFIFSKGAPSTTNLIADRKNKWDSSWGKSSVRNTDGSIAPDKKRILKDIGIRFNIWRINGGKGYTTQDDYAYEHPAMFPEALARDHILSWSNSGDVVLDPMCGSGTTLKMAKENGRHFIGFEISEEYCKIARKRVLGANVPLPLMESS